MANDNYTLDVQVINDDGFTSLKDDFSLSLDMQEEALFHAVEDKNYVSDYTRRHCVSY